MGKIKLICVEELKNRFIKYKIYDGYIDKECYRVENEKGKTHRYRKHLFITEAEHRDRQIDSILEG